MSAGYLYSANTTAQTVAIGGTINVGAPIRRFGCVKGTSTPYATANGTNTILSSSGKCPTYFDIETAMTIIPTAAGTVVITAYQDGTAIPGAITSATVAGTDATVTLPLSFGVRLNCGITTSTISYVLTGVASSVTNVAQTITKE